MVFSTNQHFDLPNRKRTIVRHAISEGVLVVTAFGLTELLFAFVIPWALSPTYYPLLLDSAIWTLAVYEIAGIAGGLLICLLLLRLYRNESDRAITLARPLTVSGAVILFGVYTAFQLNLKAFVGTLGAVTLCLCLIVLAVKRPSRYLRFVASPWSVALLLVAPLWAAEEPALPMAVGSRVARFVAAILLVLILVMIIERLASLVPPRAAFYSGVNAGWLGAGVAAVFAVLVTVSSPVKTGGHSATKKPNVFLIVLDTVRADHLSVYGYSRQTSANLDVLAKESTLFVNAVAASNVTLPTHASIFTGVPASAHGANESAGWPGAPLAGTWPTVAECLRSNGYVTMASVSNYAYLNPAFGLNRGFEVYDVRTGYEFFPFYALCRLIRGGEFSSDRDILHRRADMITSDAIRLIEWARTGDKPIFLFLNYFDAHDPYVPPKPYDQLFPGAIAGTDMRALLEKIRRTSGRSGVTVSSMDRQHLVSQYDGGIAYLDHHVGRLLRYLESQNLFDTSIIIVTSDHGEAFGEKGFLRHGNTVRQFDVGIPLIVKFPRQKKADVREALAGSTDIFPTLLETIHAERRPLALPGVSLVRPAPSDRIVLAESSWLDQSAAYFQQYKLIRSKDGKELYNIRNDPGEVRNLLGTGGIPSVAAIVSRLDEFLRKQEAAPVSPSKLPPFTLQELRSLGYLH
jgi:arylsulfatase A-like enzyme